MQPVLGFDQHARPGTVQDGRRHLFVAMGRQTVKKDGVRGGPVHERLVDLVRRECGLPSRALVLLSHGGPNVGGHHACALDGFVRVANHLGVRRALGPCQDGRVGAVAFGTRQAKGEAQAGGGVEPRVGHVVAVSDPRHAQCIPVGAELFRGGGQVGQHLAGVEQVGEAVHHRHRSVTGELEQLPMGEGAYQKGVGVAAQDAGGVRHALAPAQLGLAVRDHDGVPAQLGHRRLGADARAGRALAEDHGQRPAFQRAPRLRGVRLQAGRVVQ